jgi:CAAX prenyl protease-like protein
MFLRKQFANSPTVARVAPFVVFLLLTVCQGKFFVGSEYWLYLAKTLVGAWLIWEMRPFVTEMRWAMSWEAVVVGIVVCTIWVGLDEFYPKIGKAGAVWNPRGHFGEVTIAAWMFVIVRIVGSALVVPPLEEVFYRSFLYRYITKTDFQSVRLGYFAWMPFLVTAAVFGFAHHEWLAGILCGMAYQWLVIRKQRLGDAMTAHAITNFLLGLWVVWKGAWKFW